MTTEYVAPDISCDHCKRRIEAELAQVAGVERVAVDVASKTVRVDGTPLGEDVRRALAALGYPAEV